jgi:hypothetical protein
MYDGAATGVPIGAPGEAHNVSTINSSRAIVAGFRGTRYWVEFDGSSSGNGLFDSPYRALADGVDAVPEGGMIVIKSGSSGQGMILTRPVLLNSWSGSAVIGVAVP